MEQEKVLQIIYDHAVNGISYRNLGKKYGIGHTRIYRIIMSKYKAQVKPKEVPLSNMEPAALSEDVKTLKEELRKARLKIELQDLMIDITSKELGFDLRKKHGTRQSK
jgi:transposase